MNAPNSSSSVSTVQSLYSQLMLQQSKADTEGILAPHLFLLVKQKMSTLQTHTANTQQLAQLRQQLSSLWHYTTQFNRYKTAITAFFSTLPTANIYNFEQTFCLTFIQTLSKRLFNDFSTGNYWQSSIQPSVDLLLQKITHFKHLETSSKLTTHAGKPADLEELFIFKPLQQFNSSGSNTAKLQAYMAQYFPDTSAFTFSKQRLSSIVSGFLRLQSEELKDITQGKTNPFTQLLAQLKEALKTYNHQQISSLLLQIAEKIPPTQITQPANGSNTRFKVINVQGTTLPMSKIHLLLNNTNRFTTHANEQGFFEFSKIELANGQNTLQCHNPVYSFLYPVLPTHYVQFANVYPFVGRIDPLTQQTFKETEANQILRCANCKNYMYDYSVAENEEICVILKCNSKAFYNSKDKEFWME